MNVTAYGSTWTIATEAEALALCLALSTLQALARGKAA